MDVLRAYDVLREHERIGGQMLHGRLSQLLTVNSILLVAFFMAARTPYFPSMRLVLPIIGIIISGIFIGVLCITARDIIATHNALMKEEEKPEFGYMKEEGIRPFTDIIRDKMIPKLLGKRVPKLLGKRVSKLLGKRVPYKYLWGLHFYGTTIFGVLFIIIWAFCL